jgi:hypothetical protein
MKKLAIHLPLFLLIFSVQNNFAQDSLKATNHQFLTELNVNLFQGEISLNNVLKQIKFRYMTNDLTALRLGFTVDSKKEIHNSEQVYGTNPSNVKDKRNSTLIGLNFGFEKHFAGTKRLSPYIGGELTIGYKWSKDVSEANKITTTIKGAWYENQTVYTNVNGYSYTYVNTVTSERGFFSYGLNMVTGFDFYMAKHLFIGYEIEFGLTKKNYSDITT